MSLESNIQELTAAIVALTKRLDNLEGLPTTPSETRTETKAETRTETKAETKTEDKTEDKKVTHESLKKEFLTRIREDMSKKPLFKKLLTDKGCMKILDLTDEQLQEVSKEMLEL
jgi:hypothetical protein